MPFVTGTANSFADLLAAVQNACIANGYTLTGNVLSKGTLFAEVIQLVQTYPRLAVRCGTGQTAGVLSGASDQPRSTLGFTTNGASLGNNAFAFPMTYYVHIGVAPDEVYLVVNYGITMYQYIGFGQSSVAGLTGSGNWYVGSDTAQNSNASDIDIRTTGGIVGYSGAYINPGMFQGAGGAYQNGAVDHKLDTATWILEGSWRDAWNLLPNSPSAWNGEAILQPVTVYARRPSGFVSAVAELAHARFVAIDNVSDQQIITLGSDRWKIYPWWKRGVRGMPPVSAAPDTGTLGHAFRYDGP